MTREKALETYLESVRGRDLRSLMPLISDDVTLIMPNGQLITGKKDFEELHRDWFADSDWSMETRLARRTDWTDSALFVLAVDYSDRDGNGSAISFSYYLTLVFMLHDGEWRVILDQNTPIKKK